MGARGLAAGPGRLSAPAHRVRRSDRARRARVTVTAAGEVEVVLPRRAPARRADELVAELAPWIERQQARLRAAHELQAGAPGTVGLLGATLQLRPEPGRTRVHRVGERLLVPEGDPRPALERWYRRAAAAEFAVRVPVAAAAVGRAPGPISVRAQRTRWGSCSSSGALSFNWRLLLAPEAVLEAVVWHEVCHLAVPDHSPRFHALVQRHCPEHRAHLRWLRSYGHTLVLPSA